MYHNTTDSHGVERRHYSRKAWNQDKLILSYFTGRFENGSTASEVYEGLLQLNWISPKTPLTSIRRALTNLMNNDLLTKTSEQKKGPCGRPEYVYELPRGVQLRLVL
jgi:hypothetical protein